MYVIDPISTLRRLSSPIVCFEHGAPLASEFWEFSLQCIFASQNKRPLPVPRVRHGRKDRFEKHWSEALETKPPVLMAEDYEIRNRVMHEAYIPTEEEAVEFGDNVLVTIAPAMQTLRWRLQNAVGTASTAIISEAKPRLGLGEPTASFYDATILHDNEAMNYRRLADYMSHLRNLDELFRSVRSPEDSHSATHA